MMNPDTNEFEQLHEETDAEKKLRLEREAEVQSKLGELIREQNKADVVKYSPQPILVRPDGSPVPEGWDVFAIDEHVVIKNYTFKVAHIGEKHILFEPVGPVVIGDGESKGSDETV